LYLCSEDKKQLKSKDMMYLECTCADITADKWNELMKGAKPINYKWLVNKIKRELRYLYNDLALEYYNPYAEQCKVTKTHYILVSSAIEYFIQKN
jgi:hypothetical protein